MSVLEIEGRAIIEEPLESSLVLPAPTDVQAVEEGRACFVVRSAGFIISLAESWRRFLGKSGSSTLDPQAEFDTIQKAGFLGLMNRADDNDRRNASRIIQRPIIILSRTIGHTQ